MLFRSKKRAEEDKGEGTGGIMSSSCSSNGLLPSSASPREQDDLEARPTKEFEHDDHDLIDESDPFDIAQTKNAPIEILRQWRVIIVVVVVIIISSLFLVIITSS